jgi:hypothetical protein
MRRGSVLIAFFVEQQIQIMKSTLFPFETPLSLSPTVHTQWGAHTVGSANGRSMNFQQT